MGNYIRKKLQKVQAFKYEDTPESRLAIYDAFRGIAHVEYKSHDKLMIITSYNGDKVVALVGDWIVIGDDSLWVSKEEVFKQNYKVIK